MAIVRLKKGGQRFEVAVYPNTVETWRDNMYYFPFGWACFCTQSFSPASKRDEFGRSFAGFFSSSFSPVGWCVLIHING